MNNTFNIQRLGLLLKRKWLEFGKIYLITLAVALGVIITFYSFSLYGFITGDGPFHERSLGFRAPLFLIFGFLFITVIASSYFAHLGQKSKATIDLMIPASTLEKFLTSVFFTSLLGTVSFLLIFWATDFAFVSKIKGISDGYSNEAVYFFTSNKPKEFTSIFLITPFFLTSIFLLGSIYFNKYHYIKTAICWMIFSGIWTWIIVQTAAELFEGKIMINHNNDMSNPKLWAEVGVFALILLLTVIIWIITYVRLKEKEV